MKNKKITMSNTEVVNYINQLNELATKNFPNNVSFSIFKNLGELMRANEPCQQQIKKIQESEDVTADQKDKDLADLGEIKVKVEIRKVKETELLNSQYDYTPRDYFMLKFMLIEDEVAEETTQE